TGAMLHQVRIGRKQILRGCILEDYEISSTHDVPNEQLRQRNFGVVAVSQVHGYIRSTRGRLGLYLQLITSARNQETSLGAPACSMAARMSRSSSRFRIISPETACETFNTVASANCSTTAPLVPSESSVGSFSLRRGYSLTSCRTLPSAPHRR